MRSLNVIRLGSDGSLSFLVGSGTFKTLLMFSGLSKESYLTREIVDSSDDTGTDALILVS